MQNHTKKILALDLGVGSIGWALISVPENYNPENSPNLFETNSPTEGVEIIAMGTKIIPLDSADEKQKFEQGRAIEVNQKRTAKRQMRRGYHRYKKRRISLKKALEEKSMLDETLLSTKGLDKIQLWELRAKAVQEKLSLTHIGRVLLHLNQKRGYNQRIKGQAEDTDTKETKTEENTEETNETKTKKKEGYKDKIQQNSKELAGKTIGQKVYQELLQNPYYRTKDIIYYRSDYENEFDSIMRTQKQYYPDLLTDDFIQKLKHIIYYQRPLKSQKGLVKLCPFTERIKTLQKENGEIVPQKIGLKVAPKSSPLAQYKKILEAVNNLEIKKYEEIEVEEVTLSNENEKKKNKKRVKILSKTLLSDEERTTLVAVLQNCENMTKKQILDLLGYSDKKSNVKHTLNVDKIEGNKTRTTLAKIIGEHHPALQFNLKRQKRTLVNEETGEITELEEISQEVLKEPLYQLWHIIYSVKDIQECKNALIKRFNFDTETAQKLAEVEFSKGNSDFTNMSAKVMRHIIPYLEQGYQYDKAMEIAGYKHSKESRTKEENEQRTLKDTLALIPRNALRQPVAEKILNQMIHLVNEIINPERGWVSKEERENGTFTIHIELARELKANIEERKKIHEANKKRTKDNEEIAKILIKDGVTPSRNNIIRYRLFRGVNVDEKNKKMHALCLYSGKIFERNQIFDDKIVDKDHIIPQSIYPDDSQGNLILVYKDENKTKSNQTAYDYMFAKGTVDFERYLMHIQDAFNNGAITGVQVRNLLTTLEHDPKTPPHSTVEIKGKGKKGEYSIRVTKLDEEKGFAARDLRETSLITKEARRILQDICRNVLPTTGSVTAELRNLWGYNDILPQWHVERLRELKLDKLIEKKPVRDENGQETYIQTIKDWSKRDDYRHHAIDALVVACTTQSIIHRINTLHAKGVREELKKQLPEQVTQQEAKKAENNTRMNLLRRWLAKQCIFPYHVVKEKVDNILISYKPGKKVATWNKNKKDGKWDKTKLTLTPRGQLHEESYYGKITHYRSVEKDIKKLVEDLDKPNLFAPEDREKIFNDPKAVYYINNKDTKNLIKYFKDTKKITRYAIYSPESYFVMRYAVSSITKKDTTKEKNFPDEKKYEIIKNAFPADAKESDKIKGTVMYTVKDSKAQKEYTLNIRAIRMRTGDVKENDSYYPIRFNEKGEPITFVKPGNNHHVAIYKDKNGKLHEHLCTFWHAVERKKYRIPAVITNPNEVHNNIQDKNLPQTFINRLPNPEWQYVLSMQQNEMFVLDMSEQQVKDAVQNKNYKLLSKNLYRVQKISSGEFMFRNHLCTRVDDKKSDYIKSQGKCLGSASALQKANAVKVRINRLGEITEILEYFSEQ